MSSLDLRPLSLGEILDRTFTLYRRHFLLFIGISAIPHLLVLALSLAQTFLTFPMMNFGFPGLPTGSQPPPSLTEPSAMFAGSALALMFLTVIVNFFAYVLSQGATVSAVSELYLGRTITIGQSFGKMRGGLLILFVTMFLNLLLIGAGFIFLVIPGIYLSCRLLVLVPVVLLEGAGPGTAFSRSMALTRDSAGRAFLILLLYFAVTMAASGILAMPFEIGMFFAAFRDPGATRIWMALMQVGGSLASILASPILTIAAAVLYFDLRVRKEALDLQMMIAPTGTPSPLTGGSPTLLS